MSYLREILLKNISGLRENFDKPLYRNSLFLTLGRFAEAGFGFLFWTIAARHYSITDVGIATALVSSLGLVMLLSRLGFDVTLIRFMPTHNRSRVFNTCLWLSTIAAVVVSVTYLATVNIFSPEIAIIRDFSLLFILFSIFNSIALNVSYALLSLRRSSIQFVQQLIMGGRLFLLLPLASLGSMGILSSVGIAYVTATFFALLVLRTYVPLSRRIDWDFVRETFKYSSQNYFASLLQNLPSLLMPILIVTLIKPEDAALYYVAFAIGNLVLIIPDALSTSFFVEGSHGIDLRRGARRTIRISYLMLVPAVLFILLFGDLLLGFFGQGYVVAFDLLKIFSISSFFVTIYNLFIPLQNVRFQVRGIIIVNLVRFVLLLGLSYFLLNTLGVVGAGYAWILTYLILSISIAIFSKRNKLI